VIEGSLSLLMPAYNPGAMSRVAVASALAALREDDRLIIQDACSSDGWLDALPDDPRIEVVSEKDSGQSDALNRALARARTEWVGWLNADDVISAEGLEKLRLDGLVRQDLDVAYGNSATIDAVGELIREFSPGDVRLDTLVRQGCVLYSGSVIFRTEFLRDIGGYSSLYHYTMDYELFLRAWSALRSAPAYVPVRVGSLRLHDGTKTDSVPWRFVREAVAARRPYVKGPRLRVYGGVQTLAHALTVATTPLRATRIYRRLRHRS